MLSNTFIKKHVKKHITDTINSKKKIKLRKISRKYEQTKVYFLFAKTLFNPISFIYSECQSHINTIILPPYWGQILIWGEIMLYPFM